MASNSYIMPTRKLCVAVMMVYKAEHIKKKQANLKH